MMKIRGFAAVASIFFVYAGSTIGVRCAAQGFPSRPINVIVPYGPGGSPDVVPRVIGKKLGEDLGWQIVISNRPGADGVIACELVAKAPADGYTLLVAGTSQLALNPALYPKLPYDPIKDFAPVTLAVGTPLFLAVNATRPVHSVKELIGYAKANPGLHFGSSGNGSVHQLGMELFKMMAGVNLTHVPYKGVAQSVPAILSGDIAVMLVALPSVLPHIKSGKVRLLAVAGGKRSGLMPNLPTIAEGGLPGYEMTTEIGFLSPFGTPKDVVEKLNRAIVSVLKTPEVARQLVSMGIDPIGSSPEEYGATLRPNLEKYGRLIRETGAGID